MYNFIDVTEVSEESILPSEALKINGEYIENQISGYRTLNVQGREALSPDVISYTTGVRDGSRLKSKRYPERIITVTYQIAAESNEAFREAYNKLGGILNVENAELIFNDEQDKFFIGTPCVIDAVTPGTNVVVGKFEILCTDPFKYSVIEYEATPNVGDTNILVDYGGTYKAFPTLEADFYSEAEASEDGESVKALSGAGDCGFVAFFTEKEKIVQIGNPDEVDSEETYQKSQTLVNTQFTQANSWGSAAKSQWAVNSGVTSSDVVEQKGDFKMGVAAYATTKKNTAGALLTATSKANLPYINYKVNATATGRTADSVRVSIAITGSLATDSNYFLEGYVLVASIYIGGAWRNVTLKKATDKWRGKTGHTANISVNVTGLTATTSVLSGIKFKVTRGDSYGTSGILSETSCKNLAISPYESNIPEKYYLTASNYGTGTDWHGPSITRTIPADASGVVGAANFTLAYSQKMSIGYDSGSSRTSQSQLGAFQVLLTGANNRVICGVNVYKGASGKKANLRFYVNNKVVETTDIDLSYNNEYFQSGKSSTITKSGVNINFNICGIKKSFRDYSIKDDAVTKVTFTMTQFGTKPALAYNGLFYAKFVKDNCDTWKNIPNKFSAGDIVEAYCRNGEIHLNGVLTPSLGALGNDWEDFCLVPGLNQIGIAYSEWVAADYAPTMKVRYREVFL